MNTASLSVDAAVRSDRSAAFAPSLVRRIAHEPLLHFALIGVLIFSIAHRIETARTADQSHIVIDKALVERLAELQAAQTGLLPSKSQLDAIIESHIDDEVLFREALRMGLDQDDEIIRRRLIQKLQFLQQDFAVSNPSAEQLRAYFATHRAQFETPARVSFQHIYFSADREGDDAAHSRALQARGRIGSESVPKGDVFPFDDALDGLTQTNVTRLFGQTELAEALFKAEPGVWSLPVRSGYGWHLIYVTQRFESQSSDYEQLEDEIRAAYLRDATGAAQRRQLDTLRQRYQIVRQATASESTP